MTTAKDLLAHKPTTEVVSVTPDTTVQDAARLMKQRRIGSVLVMSGDDVAGIFTERDVLNRVVAEARDARATRVRDVMTTDLICVGPDRPIDEIEAIMQQKRIRRVPVVGEGGLLGILSIGDFTAHHAAENQQAVEYFAAYVYGRS